MTLQDWLEVIDAHLCISGKMCHPNNSHINVSIKQNGPPYRDLDMVTSDDFCKSVFGRDEGNDNASLRCAIQSLIDQIKGRRVRINLHIFNVPEDLEF